jgi:alpha-beta hydrolase superfamily lysophospholipase
MNSAKPRFTVTENNLSLSYIKFGNNGPFIIALHGHGRVAEDFSFLKDKGIVISIDLFFHGQSKFPKERIEKNPLTTEEFYHLFKMILKNEGVTRYHLVAFSQGGRFALSLMPQEISNCLSIQLISPDGMDNKSFYNRMSRIRLARNLFIRWEKKPSKFITMTGILKIIGMFPWGMTI